MTAFASIDNVIFVFYQAALSGEISKDAFLKAKEIIKRTTLYTTSDILDMTARLGRAKEIEDLIEILQVNNHTDAEDERKGDDEQ